MSDVEVVHVEQSSAMKAFKENKIDAYVTYPPVSLELLEKLSLRKIFTSADIPREVIDTISVSKEVLKQDPYFHSKFRSAWQNAVEYFHNHPLEASNMLAEKLGVSAAEFNKTLRGLVILDGRSQLEFFQNREELEESVQHVCATLKHTNTLDSSCSPKSELFVHF